VSRCEQRDGYIEEGEGGDCCDFEVAVPATVPGREFGRGGRMRPGGGFGL